MKRYLIALITIILAMTLAACSPKVSYQVMQMTEPGISEDVLQTISVLRGEKGHLLNLRGYYVFTPEKFSITDTYVWICGNGTSISVKSVAKKGGIITIALNEDIPAKDGINDYLLLKFKGKQASFDINAPTPQGEFDAIVIEETRQGLPGKYLGHIDQNSIEIKVDADMAWPKNDRPTVFRLDEGVKEAAWALRENEHVVLSFRREKNGDLVITDISLR